MAEQFQVDGDKTPASKSNDGVKHGGLFWLKAYTPPALIGVQGLSLCIYLSPHPRSLALGFLLFGIYLFEGMGILSPEDRINQPQRFQFFKQHRKSALLLVGASLCLGLLLLWTLSPPFWRPSGALILSGIGFVLYVLFRWKVFGLLKPFLVSFSWVLALWGFSLIDFRGNEILYLGLFSLLFLDSLWLDLKDSPGDGAYGFNIKHLERGPMRRLFALHLFLAIFLGVLIGIKDPLFVCNGILLISGVLGMKISSRWIHSLLVPVWSIYLLFVSI